MFSTPLRWLSADSHFYTIGQNPMGGVSLVALEENMASERKNRPAHKSIDSMKENKISLDPAYYLEARDQGPTLRFIP